jgi:hypothetical protein
MPDKHAFEMDISRKALEKSPSISMSEWPDKFLGKLEMQGRSDWLNSVYVYYKCNPPWSEPGSAAFVKPAEEAVPEAQASEKTAKKDHVSEPEVAGVSSINEGPERRKAFDLKRFQRSPSVETNFGGDGEVRDQKEVLTEMPKKKETTRKSETHFIPTTRLVVYAVVDESGETMGQVECIIVDMFSGRVAYMLVGLKGQTDDRWVAAPPNALTWQAARNDFKLGVPRKILEGAPYVLRADWPEKFLAELEKSDHSGWLEDVYRYYAFTPFWVAGTDEKNGIIFRDGEIK